MEMEPTERGIRARADLATALVLVALGLVVLYFSWTMPRLEARRIHPATIPGLVPMLLGAALAFCGTLLGLRSLRIPAPGGWTGLMRALGSKEAMRVGAVLALALFHTLVLLGRVPFWAASSLFIFAFILLFEHAPGKAASSWLRTGLWALGIALVAGLGIAFVFERIFLVRLP